MRYIRYVLTENFLGISYIRRSFETTSTGFHHSTNHAFPSPLIQISGAGRSGIRPLCHLLHKFSLHSFSLVPNPMKKTPKKMIRVTSSLSENIHTNQLLNIVGGVRKLDRYFLKTMWKVFPPPRIFASSPILFALILFTMPSCYLQYVHMYISRWPQIPA